MNYSDIAVQWDDSHRYSPASRHRRRLILRMLKNIRFGSCLDVGCAQPYLLESICKDGIQAAGCDISSKVIAENRERFKNMEFQVVDISRNAYPGGRKFELVICSEVLEHIADWQTALKNIASMSERYLLITVPSGRLHPIDRKVGHVRHFDFAELIDEMLKNGFHEVERCSWGFPVHSFYKYAINAVAPDKIYSGFTGRYNSLQKMISNMLYWLFYMNDLFNDGAQLILLLKRKNK